MPATLEKKTFFVKFLFGICLGKHIFGLPRFHSFRIIFAKKKSTRCAQTGEVFLWTKIKSLHFRNFHRISGRNSNFLCNSKSTLNNFQYFFRKVFLSSVCPTGVMGLLQKCKNGPLRGVGLAGRWELTWLIVFC